MDRQGLKIGVVLGSGPESGGGFQYEHRVLSILKNLSISSNIEIQCYSFYKDVISSHKDLNIPISLIKDSAIERFHRSVLSTLFGFKILTLLKQQKTKFEKRLKSDGVDLIYFLYPNPTACSLIELPYIFTLWDLGHLDLTEFPEIVNNGQFLIREDMYKKSLNKAFIVTVDSEFGKKRAIEKYLLDEKRVEVLKFLPSIEKISDFQENINISEKYHINKPFIYYPAQFWPHKNHIYILDALKILKDKFGIKISAAFSGSNKGNLDYVLEYASALGIEDQVHYLGFVPQHEIPFLYRQSISLVMPTYLGPTNIPPLEALYFETPVCYSDKPSFREQLKDAALYMDLENPESLVDHIRDILSNYYPKQEMKEAGEKILSDWNEKHFEKKLISMIRKFQYIRKRWK